MIVPIFPLPNVVLFPKTLLPLHIFEDRYRAMVKSALDGDATIAIVLLREDLPPEPPDKPPVHDIACLGKIETYEELEGGRYNILVSGTRRVRLLWEVESAPYRRAEVEPLDDLRADAPGQETVDRRNRLTALFSRFAELVETGEKQTRRLFPTLDFEALVNTVASTLNFPARHKQLLLETDDILERCDTLLPVLQRQVEALVIVRKFEKIRPQDPGRN
jgi:Lon protease-like protein